MKAYRFSLVDLGVIVGVCLVAGALLMPAVVQARSQARASHCQNNLKMIGLALHNYHDTFGVFAPGRVWQSDPKRNELDPGVATMLLPFLEQAALYNSYNFNLAWSSAQNRTTRSAKIELLLCPEDKKESLTANVEPAGQPLNYVFNLGAEAWLTSAQPAKPGGSPPPEGLFFDNSRIGIRDIIDGTSNTVMVSEQVIDRPRRSGSPASNGECSGDVVEGKLFSDRTGSRWVTGHPSSGYYNARRTPNHPDPDCFDLVTPRGVATLNKTARSNHPAGVHVLMADGRVQFAPNSIDLTVWRQLHTRNGMEVIDTERVLQPPIPAPPGPNPGRSDRGPAPPAAVELTLRTTTGPENVDDKEGRWQYYGGDLIAENATIGHFSAAIRVSSANPLNAGAVRMTLFIKGEDPPDNVILDGSHSFSSGSETGSVSAASERFRQFIGASYRVSDNKLTISVGNAAASERARPVPPQKP